VKKYLHSFLVAVGFIRLYVLGAINRTATIKTLEVAKMARLKDFYKNTVVPAMMNKFGYKNVMQVPKIEKIVINMGVGEGSRDIKVLDAAENDLAIITGQKSVTTRSKKAISAFKLRVGMPIGCMVTLHGKRMYEFLDRLINVAIPRIKDFRGLSPKSFDGRGNYCVGIKDHMIFTELEYDKVLQSRGMNIVTCTTAKTDEEAKELLSLIGMPFRS